MISLYSWMFISCKMLLNRTLCFVQIDNVDMTEHHDDKIDNDKN